MTKDTAKKLADACMRVGCANIVAHKEKMADIDIELLREAERGIFEVLVEIMREVE